MNKFRYPLVVILASCGFLLFCYAPGRTQSDVEGQEATANIPFNDTTHIFFFNYQTYLIKHGRIGDTPDTWAILSAPDRARKVATGEAKLNALRIELQAKAQMSSEDIELWESVWGRNKNEVSERGAHAAVIARDKSVPIESINTVARRLDGFQSTSNWNLLFDGSANSSKEAAAINAAIPMDHAATSRRKSAANISGYANPTLPPAQWLRDTAIVRNREEFWTPAANNNEKRSSNGALPFAAGLVLLAGGYVCAKRLFEEKGATGSASDGDMLPMLKERGFGSSPTEIANAPENINLSRPTVASTTCSDGSCSMSCAGGCQDSCSFGCTTGCKTTCSGCSGHCEGGCQVSCGGKCWGCYNSCGGTCAGTVDG